MGHEEATPEPGDTIIYGESICTVDSVFPEQDTMFILSPEGRLVQDCISEFRKNLREGTAKHLPKDDTQQQADSDV